ncbi:MAG: bacteriohopanetetrol glucosamine biosynthesis glycosyltransferase HpnI [Alphaproteobacteria bacterium]|nr:bacteriohopanetetrol glucosamine biosynthesis glycosyltransferase HpnI [Alphaproteobacteria bacterium]
MLSAFAFAMAGVLGSSFIYLLLAITGVLRFARETRRATVSPDWVPVTVLKPVCGLEPGLLESLQSFCDQDFTTYQVIFGVRDPKDLAIPIIEKVIGKFPDKDLSLVVNERVLGGNLKASNLANVFEMARHDIIVVADSDMRVRRDYLKAVATPFLKTEVGAATCLYSGVGDKNLASRMGAMFINDWFLPSALISTLFVDLKFCFGATMAIRREALRAIGGFEALANFLADDYMLGNATAGQGYKVALVPYVVENMVFENNLRSLFFHEIRWARTIRSVQPGGYAMSFITDVFPLSLLAAITVYVQTSSLPWAVLPVIGALFLRTALHYVVQNRLAGGAAFSPWLIPARDLFSLAVRISSFFGREVRWRDQVMTVRTNSRLDPSLELSAARTKGPGARNEKDIVSQPTYV